MRSVSGGKRPRGVIVSAENQGGTPSSLPWTGRVPKPAMDADSLVDYGSGFLRKSCDSCVSSKRRCDGQDPCTRCQRRKKPCHYTERKKCGPRSGQKTSKGTRRARLVASSPTNSTGSSQQSPTNRAASEQQAQQQYDAISHVPRANTSGRPLAEESLEWQYSGMSLGAPPPPHAHPTLSADELSGETTGVDYTDVSDAPPHRYLSRDGSGSSWWSLEEQQANIGMGMVAMGQSHGMHHMQPAALTVGGGRAHPSAMQSHAAIQAATWNAVQAGRRFPVGATPGGTHRSPPQYPQHQVQHQHAKPVPNGGMVMAEWGSHGRGGGPASSTASGMSLNSTNSVGDSSEDDDTSETGLGQDEEEVAAMLVSLGQPRTFCSEEADELRSRTNNDEVAAPVAHGRSPTQQHRGWAYGRT